MSEKGKKKAAKEKIGVAERKRAEEALRESEERYRQLVELSPDKIVIHSEDKFIFINTAGAKLLGAANPKQLIGKPIMDFIHPDYREIVKERIREVVEGRKISYSEEKSIRLDGTDIHAETAAIPLTHQGKPAVLSISRDITERKQAEEALSKSENKYRTLLENLPQRILLKDKNLVYVSCNEIYARDLKIKPDEIAGKTDYDIFPKEVAEKHVAQDKKCLETGEIVIEDVRSLRAGRKGIREWVRVVKTPVRDEKGNTVGVLGIYWDITERKRADEALHKLHDELEVKVAERTEELSQANIRLKELDKLKSMFMASMSHELRTPLNSIIGFTGVMLQGIAGKITGEQRKQLTMVQNSSNHLLSMVTDIIDLNKIEAGKIEVLIKETDIAKTIDEVLATFADKIREKGLTLKKNIPEKLIISTDEKRFKQILINLLDNAVKFTVEGSIEVDCKVKGEEIEISVKDTGPGIREAGIEELFKPFALVDYEFKVKYGGPGIGLYLSKRIAELLGGKIWAKSEFGKGSRFTLVLPMERVKT